MKQNHEDAILQYLLKKTKTLPLRIVEKAVEKQELLSLKGKTCQLSEILLEEGHLNSQELNRLQLLEGFIPGYRIEKQIGLGKFGIVYKAWQLSMKRFVAIKVLNPNFSQEQPCLGRFLRETHALGKLAHPHIIRGLDSGEIGHIHYLVMEYFDGIPLSDYLKACAPLPEIEVLRMARDLVSALKHIGEQNLLHRDITPENIMMGKSQIKICDFGLVRAISKEPSSTRCIPVNSYAYVSPEQAMGDSLDFHSDCFSLGGVLYTCLTGETPFPNSKNISEMEKREAVAPKDCVPGVSSPTNDLVMRLLSKEASKRCQSVFALEQEIQALLERFENIERSSRRGIREKIDMGIAFTIILLVLYLSLWYFPQEHQVQKTTPIKIVQENVSSIPEDPAQVVLSESQTLKASEIYNLRVPSVVIIKSSESMGGGVIMKYHDKTLIVTNAHVVEGSLKVKIIFKDERECQGEVVICNRPADLALVSIPKEFAQETPLMPLVENEEDLEVGEDVFVIGHPKGYHWSLSRGTISGIRGHTIQTDAAINPGNSGGPLLNREGEMIGITTFIVDKTNNLGFGIATSRILEFLDLVSSYPHAKKRFVNYKPEEE